MRIDLDRSEYTVKVARMSHGDKYIDWNVSAFDRSNFDVEFDLFDHCNKFWEGLSPSSQEYVFDLYSKMNQIVCRGKDRDARILELINLIKEFYEFHNLDIIKSWIYLKSDIVFPSWLSKCYTEKQDSPGSREQTYLYDDYVNLICLAFCLRMMIPVWSEFIGRTRDETSTSLKEYRAYHLLSRSSLFESEPMHKLRTYVNAIVPTERQKSAIIEGMSTEEFPTWLLSVALIRKVCVSDIRGIFPPSTRSANGTVTDPPTLVTYIYNHIKERIKHSGNNFSGIVNDKKNESSNNDSYEQQMSRFEGYKIKQEISPGDVVVIETVVEDPYKVAAFIEPTISMDFVTECLNNRVSRNLRIYDPQFILAQWVMKPFVSPRGMLYLNKALIQQCCAVAEAVLWHRGHKFYSALMSAEMHSYDEGVSTVGIGSDARIPKDLNEEILKYYPYMRKNTASKSKTVRSMNQAYVAVDHICGLFSKAEWGLTISDDRLIELLGSTNLRRVTLQHDAKIRLCELVVDIAKRSKIQYERYIQVINQDYLHDTVSNC